MTARRWLAIVVVAVAPLAGLVDPLPATAQEFAVECEYAPAGPSTLAIGTVGCLRIPSSALGAPAPFSYYIPPACAPSSGARCPVLYYLHGTGGSYRTLGTIGSTGNNLVKALTAGPPVDTKQVPDPWKYSDPATWVPKPAIDLILVTPHGLTLPGGYGPVPNANAFWFDWNPRYAAGGDDPKYDTPPPRFETHLVGELVPYVDRYFPTIPDREGRAIDGKSMGGIGALANGLKHPDVWASIGAMSGGGLPSRSAAGVGPLDQALAPVDLAPPAPVPFVRPPGVVPQASNDTVWDTIYGSVATVGFGDLVTENIWFRANTAAELVQNARAYRRSRGTLRQVPHLRYHVNDTIARRIPEDVQDSGYPYNQGFESILMPPTSSSSR